MFFLWGGGPIMFFFRPVLGFAVMYFIDDLIELCKFLLLVVTLKQKTTHACLVLRLLTFYLVSMCFLDLI